MVGGWIARYRTPLLMSSDILLVFKNCISFNEQSYPSLAAIARSCMVDFKKRLKKAGLSTFSDKPPTTAEKKRFSQLIYNISTVDLGQIVAILENNCSASIQKNPSNQDEVCPPPSAGLPAYLPSWLPV